MAGSLRRYYLKAPRARPRRSSASSGFYREVGEALGTLGMPVSINEHPQEVRDPIPFSEDRRHHSYDPVSAHAFWQVLSRVDTVMKQHRAGFWGKTSPVHFFWGGFDLANTRFSGRHAAPPEGAEVIMRYAEDAEQICAGFWPGDERTPFPAFYAYGYPRPKGCEEAVCRPDAARWVESQACSCWLTTRSGRVPTPPGAFSTSWKTHPEWLSMIKRLIQIQVLGSAGSPHPI